jgi:Protein CHAPERONE-LIKE PROTEIN OF POR1-like
MKNNEQNPYIQLGVKENASFEEIQAAKQRLTEQYQHDSQIVETIEAAYDSIIMDRLRLRQEGKIKVPEGIRFAEETPPEKKSQFNLPTNQTPVWLQEFIDTPTQEDVLQSGVLFLGLTVLIFFADASLLMALAFAGSIYFLNRKEQRFGRSVLITLVGLVLGIALGGGLVFLFNNQAGLNFLTSDQISSIVTFLVFWLFSSFLR